MNNKRHSQLRSLAAQITRTADTLWSAGPARRAAWLSRAFKMLSDPESQLFRNALAEVPGSSQLSREMVRWALDSTLSPLTEHALLALYDHAPLPNVRARRAQPGQLCVVILAGNVFTAAAKAVGLPLLFGLPVLAKTAASDGAFVHLLENALRVSDAELSEAFRVVTVDSQDDQQTSVLFEQADVVSAYGNDRTLNAIRAQLGATVSFVGHGHGLGAAYITDEALMDEGSARLAAQQLAFDVAAYDQRGCLSPQVAWIQRGREVTPERFTELLHETLTELERKLPRGRLPLQLASAQLNFRAAAAMRGTLLEGSTHAVTYESDGPVRTSPGYRNVQLLGVDGLEELCQRLAPLGVHLKCLGIAGIDSARVVRALPGRITPRVCALGMMQMPRADALHDGLAWYDGLVRYVEDDA